MSVSVYELGVDMLHRQPRLQGCPFAMTHVGVLVFPTVQYEQSIAEDS